MAGYKVELTFKKHFTRGNLAGMTVSDVLRFTSKAAAARWEKGLRANMEKGLLPFWVSDLEMRSGWGFKDAAAFLAATNGVED